MDGQREQISGRLERRSSRVLAGEGQGCIKLISPATGHAGRVAVKRAGSPGQA
jgi:hypothetical protein